MKWALLIAATYGKLLNHSSFKLKRFAALAPVLSDPAHTYHLVTYTNYCFNRKTGVINCYLAIFTKNFSHMRSICVLLLALANYN